MMREPFLALCYLGAFITGTCSGQDCVIHLEKFHHPESIPLVAQDGELLYPIDTETSTGNRLIIVPEGTNVTFACPPPSIFSNRGGASFLTYNCDNKKLYKLDGSGSYILYMYLYCINGGVKPSVRRTQDADCATNGADGRSDGLDKLSLVQIGWDLAEGGGEEGFDAQVTLCVDEQLHSTLWARHAVSGVSLAYADAPAAVPAAPAVDAENNPAGLFAGVDVAAAYSTASHAGYSPGQLSPGADFVFKYEQESSYFYSNMAPQRSVFDGGNWLNLEEAVRQHVKDTGAHFAVLTGTHGQLRDSGGNPIYYAPDSEGEGVVTAPLYFWKAIINRDTGESSAFVVGNQPSGEDQPEALCSGNCSTLSWIDFDTESTSDGRIDCCSFMDLRAAVPNAGAAAASAGVVWQECVLDLEEHSREHTPLYLVDDEFVYPGEETAAEHRLIKIADGSILKLMCHGSSYYPSNLTISGTDQGTASTFLCQDGVFKDTSSLAEVSVGAYECTGEHAPRFKIDSPSPCAGVDAVGAAVGGADLARVRIGWQVAEDTFHTQIEICHDERSDDTLWTKHTMIGSATELRDTTPGRPPFRRDLKGKRDDRFFTEFSSDTDVNRKYYKTNQVDYAIKILGANLDFASGNVLFTTTKSNYLSRGHLAPDAGFIYDSFQDATYYFINVAPQFQSFNNGNWRMLEDKIRRYGDETKNNVEVYTGIFGRLTLDDEDGIQREMYLYKDSNSTHFIHVPLHFWKVLHDKTANRAVAFIGVNNPHLQEDPDLLCQNRCSTSAWGDTDWSVSDLTKGFTYCCSAEDFKAAVAYAPQVTDQNGNWPNLMTDEFPLP